MKKIGFSRCVVPIIVYFATGLIGIACATVKEFNEAVARRDYNAATSAALQIWPTFDRNSKQAALVAREFGFIAFMAGKYDTAKLFAEFVVNDGPALPYPDNQPAVSRVLLELVKYKLDGKKAQRQKLLDALQDRINGDAGTEAISLFAAEDMLMSDWREHQWNGVTQSAKLAMELSKRGGSPWLVNRRRAQLIMIASEFISAGIDLEGTRARSTYGKMSDLFDGVVEDINATEAADKGARDALWPVLFSSMAWSDAMWAKFEGEKRQVGTHIPQEIKKRPRNFPKYSHRASTIKQSNLPICKGAFLQQPKIEYPGSAEFKGMVGSVLVSLLLDEQGRVIDPEVVAAVPAADFSAAVLKAVRTWRWVTDKGEDTSRCRIRLEEQYLPVVFTIY